jgi:hypothetical protein
MSKTYRLFISHSWAYSDTYDGLVNLLNKSPAFPYIDYSVPRNDPIHNAGTDKELLEAIKRQMAPCHAVLMLAGVYSTYSKWINKEIALAAGGFTNPKPIIGIAPWGQENLSSVVQAAAVEIVRWQKSSIEGAIRLHSL